MDGKQTKRAVDIAARAGTVLLSSGSDITRVEDTIRHMMNSFGVKKYDIFTITNGIFLSASADDAPEGMGDYTRICEVPKNSSDLGKVDLVNTLSRDIEAGLCDMDGAEKRLDQIEKARSYKTIISLLAAGVASGAFSYLFGGSAVDALLAALIGFSYYYLFIVLDRTKLSKLLCNAICGCILALMTVGFVKLIPGVNMDMVIVGAIMPLIPGVAFVNAVRDIAAGDYISGAIRMIDAIAVAAGIAVGVGVTILIFTRLGVI
ncbi:MAG: threonine/serine exporter family protein [Clostridia bacterium]|nr:threonine/serine exporter family protein [Clostridia bacterium]